ncbi:hypothetical protein DENIS_1613 [Desulfonema ishimotonii]|uniref:Uncharacterized protein n=1 Tax=Desulfonema ishimotonii TaxID=45657 RepID=A0A401FUL1_9BACT|nr:hypothetical protein DENIS_1613 [Desulfonema ishimotonii]
MIPEQLPLKQGLKHTWWNEVRDIVGIPEQLPLKQGLKLYDMFDPAKHVIIPEQLPLKQGLKLTYSETTSAWEKDS